MAVFSDSTAVDDVFRLDIVEHRRVTAPCTNDSLPVQIDVQGEEGQIELSLTKGPKDELVQRVDELTGGQTRGA